MSIGAGLTNIDEQSLDINRGSSHYLVVITLSNDILISPSNLGCSSRIWDRGDRLVHQGDVLEP